jgi:hypothetical protein
MPRMKSEVIGEFFDEVVEKLSQKLGNDWIVEKVGLFVRRYGFPLRIYKQEWVNKNFLLFGFEFDVNNYYDGRFGIVRNNKNTNMQDISNQFSKDIDKIDISFNTTSWWLFQHKLPDRKDFVEQILFDDLSSESFVNSLYTYISKVEIENSLLSNINNYINERGS